jgi:hypothetical protein
MNTFVGYRHICAVVASTIALLAACSSAPPDEGVAETTSAVTAPVNGCAYLGSYWNPQPDPTQGNACVPAQSTCPAGFHAGRTGCVVDCTYPGGVVGYVDNPLVVCPNLPGLNPPYAGYGNWNPANGSKCPSSPDQGYYSCRSPMHCPTGWYANGDICQSTPPYTPPPPPPKVGCAADTDCKNPCMRCESGSCVLKDKTVCSVSSTVNGPELVINRYYCRETTAVPPPNGSGCFYTGCKALSGYPGFFTCQDNACEYGSKCPVEPPWNN